MELPYDPKGVLEHPLHELTQSAISTGMGCQQKYVLDYLFRLRLRAPIIPLIIGKAYHLAIECWFNALIKGEDPLHTAYDPAIAKIDATFDRVLARTDLISVGSEEKLEHARAITHSVFHGWSIIGGAYAAEWTINSCEQAVRCAPDATGLDRIGGRLDGDILDNEGRPCLVEHKTFSSQYKPNVSSLSLNFQAMTYIIIAERIGLRMRIMMYNGVQKPQHKMSTKGFDDLVKRMSKAIIEDPEKYVIVTPILIDDSSVQRAKRHLLRAIDAIDNINKDNVVMSTSRCNDFGGCSYKPLCQEGCDVAEPGKVFNTPGIELYHIRSVPHAELEEDSTTEIHDEF